MLKIIFSSYFIYFHVEINQHVCSMLYLQLEISSIQHVRTSLPASHGNLFAHCSEKLREHLTLQSQLSFWDINLSS